MSYSLKLRPERNTTPKPANSLISRGKRDHHRKTREIWRHNIALHSLNFWWIQQGRQLRVITVLSALIFYALKAKDALHLPHNAVIGWARLEPSHRKNSCSRGLTPETAYYLKRICRFELGRAVLLAFDCQLRWEEVRVLTKRKRIHEIGPIPRCIYRYRIRNL